MPLRKISRLFGGARSGQPAARPGEGFTPIEQVDPQDILIVGYPKSGNTWVQHLAAGVVWGVVLEYAPKGLRIVPDMHANTEYKRYGTPMYFKSHHMPRPDFRRVVYLVRDGRDAMVSYYHYLKNTNREVDFMEMIRTGTGLFPGKWHDHVNAWMENPHDAKMLVIRYEDLKADTVKELVRFCEFAGIQREPEFLEMIARTAQFARLRRKEDKAGPSGSGDNWVEGGRFFRRGIVGSYRDEMPPEVLEAFMAEAKPSLERFGYV